MPEGRPAVGELWATTDNEGRVVRGIISDVQPTVVTLVSITGQRARVAPSRLATNWTFDSAAPGTPFVCSRRGCASTAVFRYYHGASPDYTCPRHAPTGTHLELLTNDPSFGVPRFSNTSTGNTCPSCQGPDPIADQSLNTPDAVAGWSCLRCNNRWFTIRPSETTTITDNWWLTNIQAALDELERLQRPAGVIEAHPSAHASILRALMARSINVGEHITAGTAWSIFNIPVTMVPILDPDTVIIRPIGVTPFTIEGMETRPLEDTLIRPGTRWIHRSGGRAVEVISVRDSVVTFRQEGSPLHMILEDFLSLHKPFVLDDTPPETLNITLLPGEEYESAEGLVQILSVDSKRELVDVTWPDGRKRMPLQLREFATSKWRKIERRTAYQRIMDDDED